MEDLDIFSSSGNYKRILLPPPASRKHVPQDMSYFDKLAAHARPLTSGTEYVSEFVEKEEKELLESATGFNQNDKPHKFDEVSHGTSVPANDTETKDLTKIYRTYDFAYRPKENLTIASMKDEIVSMIDTNSVVVIKGPTGCGKTTQVPQFILDSCYRKRVHCNIIVTQPRRIAAMSIAKRVSQEREWPVGSLVGYQVGLMHSTCPDTRLTYCTTGVLLHKLIHKKNMLDFTHVILDEVHERDQDMDFLLLVVRKLLRTNSRNVKIILMSATFQVDKFAKYFSSPVRNKLVPAPIIDVVKMNFYNVAIYYLCQITSLGPIPEVSVLEPSISRNMMEFCLRIVIVFDDVDMKADDACYNEESGTYERHVVLIFLPGIHEIEEMHNLLSSPKYEELKWDIVVLHSSISNEEQQRIFRRPPKGYRRIILSTNIAESSITVPDVKYVIDFCLTKQLVTDPATNFQCLELSWASKTNCDQRAGRTGRVMDGRVYRLVPEEFYEKHLPLEVPPEILRAPLANVVLKTKLLDLGEPKALLALSLDPPDLSNLERTILLLKEAGALLNRTDDMKRFDGELTDLGRIMANLPLQIQVTKLIMLGHVFSIFDDAIIIAACMSVKDVFCNPFREKFLAYKVKLTWADSSCSDSIAAMNVYKVWIAEKANRRLPNDKVEKKWAIRNFVQLRVLREIKALIHEITSRLERLGITQTAGVNKVVWREAEKPFILKMVIAGAFYPNYFVRRVQGGQMDERTGIRLLGGLDPAKTVYVQGWPLRQPGPLYARRFQNIFKDCLTSSVGKIKVSFEASSRVYIQFSKSENYENSSKENVNKISLPVYKAIKMRQCNTPIEIPVLEEGKAMELAEELNLVKPVPAIFSNSIQTENADSLLSRPQLPGLLETYIPINIQHVIDPGHFWVHIKDIEVQNKAEKIRFVLNASGKPFKEFSAPPEIGKIVIAPYEQKNKNLQYHRAKVESYTSGSEILVRVLFIDYGYRTEVRLRDLKQFNDQDPIAKIPALALECVLANIRPSVVHGLSENWSPAAYSLFTQLINKPGDLFGEIYSIVNSIVSINLIHKNNYQELINFNECFIEKGFAIQKVEDYFSRCNHEIRMKSSEMSTEECRHYEELQYEQDYAPDTYPQPPSASECYTTIKLRGPFSPLECELTHLSAAGRGRKVNIFGNSVNSVLLDKDPENPHEGLLIAGCVSQSAHSNNLTVRDTTLMLNLPGLMALTILTFTPYMELRRNSYGTHYVGALCGLGFDPATGRSIFPEHDMEIMFDVDLTIDDLQHINRLRHWMNMGMQINDTGEDNMEEVIIWQSRIKDAFLKLMEKSRKPRKPEVVPNFNKWNRYHQSLFLQTSRPPMVKNNIFKLHQALELEEENETEELSEHVIQLRALAQEDALKTRTIDMVCKLCDAELHDIFQLRIHLYSTEHEQREQQLGIAPK